MHDSMSRRRFVLGTSTLVAGGILRWSPLAAQDARTAASANIQWQDVRDWGVEGKAWQDTEKYFDRLPARAKGKVRDAVWNLSRHSAGMLARFRTDAQEIWVDYEVTSSNLAMPHMPATGVSGVDLYAEVDDGQWRWLSVSRPTSQHTSAALISDLAPGKRSYTLYLPLYNGTQSLKIGVPKGTAFEPIAPRSEKPLVFYGTSITHGACASRPGMPHPAILGRRLQRPVINLGFSGNGRMESEVGEFLTEVDASVFVIDCLPNMKGAEVAARAVPLVKQLRAARPQAAILLVEDRTYPNAYLLPKRQQSLADNRKALRAAYAQLRDAGVERLGYVVGDDLLGEDRDDTTDGSHPSDLGFFRQADALEKQLVKLL
jgi:hypothetical protein